MLEAIKKRWARYNPRFGLIALRGHNYGERLRDYPLKVAIKMLAGRLALILPLSILLPDRRLLVNHHGTKIYLEFINHGVTPFDLALGVYEHRITKLLFDLIKEGMTIVDIGAFEGDHSMMFAHWMHDKGKILAFEPEPNNCRWFRRNMEVNNYKCIDLYECALSDREGTATFHPGTGVGSLVLRSWWKTGLPITVKTQTLDNILNQAHIDKVDLIKIDVEGGDLLVLKGAQRTLKNNRAHLIMDVDVVSNMERSELFELLTSFGYEIYRVGKQLTRIKSADELFLFPGSNVIPNTPIGPRTKFRPSTIREIYAVKRNGA
jgi:FkbM family methyltransferase